MNHKLIEEVRKLSVKSNIPALNPGMTVKVYQKIKEGDKERIQAFEGVVIAVGSGTSVEKNFTVRKMVGDIGVEKIFPFHSPVVTKVEIKKAGKVRRSKLYYMRDRSGKAARMKDIAFTKEVEQSIEQLAAQKAKEEAEKAAAEAPAAPAEEVKAA